MALTFIRLSTQIGHLLAGLSGGSGGFRRGPPATGWDPWLLPILVLLLPICLIIAYQAQGGWRRKLLIIGLWLVGMAALVHFGHVIGDLFLPK